MRTRFILVSVISLGLFFACGQDDGGLVNNNGDDNGTYTLPTPLVQALSPSTVSAGEEVTVIGSGFVEPTHGRTMVFVNGTFTDKDGVPSPVSMSIEGTYVNPGKLTFIYENQSPPEGFGDTLGEFVGTASAINIGHDKKEQAQEEPAEQVQMDVGPSIAVWHISPMDQGCVVDRITDSAEGSKIMMDIEFIGLASPSTVYPTTLEVVYQQFSHPTVDNPYDPEDTDDTAIRHYTINITDGNSVTLEDIDFGSLPDDRLVAEGTISLQATDQSGTTIQRTVAVRIHRRLYVDYDGNEVLAELEEPVTVSGCLPGGEYGRNYGYNEGRSETRTRGISLSHGISISPWILNLSFGVNVSASVSSTESESLSISGHVIPNQFGVFYRQTQRLLRRGDVVEYTSCGIRQVIGEALLTDWNWSPDLAITHNGTCPPAPPSNLPAAEVFTVLPE